MYDGPSRGLGDTVERLAKLTGIKAIVKVGEATASAIAGRPVDCGCGGRRVKLNQAVPYQPTTASQAPCADQAQKNQDPAPPAGPSSPAPPEQA